MKHKAIPFIASILLSPAVVAAADEETAMLRRVADSVLKQTTRRLIDRSTGETFTDHASAKEAGLMQVPKRQA